MPRQFDDDPRWAQVLARSADAEGRFVYAVKSTGVFCRPTCPSRRPRREQVRFFDHPAEAERAGFRACLRCRPDGARPVTDGAKAVARAAALPARPRRRAGRAGRPGRAHRPQPVAPPARLHRAHRRLAARVPGGLPGRALPCVAARGQRRHHARPTRPATDRRAGCRRTSPPARARRRRPTAGAATGVAIGYAVVPCSLGRLLVAATAAGVCAVKLGSSDRRAGRGAAPRVPQGRRCPRPRRPAAWTRAIARAADGAPAAVPGVPLDVQGTAFQWTVWKALQAIPAGETRTYAEVARAVGRPRAVRAVASACARNPVALVVPCHRVVPQGRGRRAGIAGAPSRKRALLDRESARRGRTPRRPAEPVRAGGGRGRSVTIRPVSRGRSDPAVRCVGRRCPRRSPTARPERTPDEPHPLRRLAVVGAVRRRRLAPSRRRPTSARPMSWSSAAASPGCSPPGASRPPGAAVVLLDAGRLGAGRQPVGLRPDRPAGHQRLSRRSRRCTAGASRARWSTSVAAAGPGPGRGDEEGQGGW